ncbi:MAG: zinc-binding dehydrogenase [Gammaproteobacteria bacterium]
MTTGTNIVIRIARQPPPGPLAADTFDYVEEPLAPLADGEIRVESIYAAIDAGSRAALDDQSAYVIKTRPGGRASTSAMVGRVVDSRHPEWRPGEYARVLMTTRQQYVTLTPAQGQVFKADPAAGPLAMHAGLLGLTGFTAWVGIFEIGRPKAGETVLVSAAAGAVGSVAGQYARIAGARVIGIAGGPDKCRFVREQFGFDDCIDYKHEDVGAAIERTCPEGVDVYFENVGGEIQKAAFARLNDFGRVAMCGQIAQYSGAGEPPGPNLMQVVLRRLRVHGFLASDHMELLPRFTEETSRWYREGRIRQRTSIVEGMRNLHEAINALVEGRNLGQQLHQMAADPTAA